MEHNGTHGKQHRIQRSHRKARTEKGKINSESELRDSPSSSIFPSKSHWFYGNKRILWPRRSGTHSNLSLPLAKLQYTHLRNPSVQRPVQPRISQTSGFRTAPSLFLQSTYRIYWNWCFTLLQYNSHFIIQKLRPRSVNWRSHNQSQAKLGQKPSLPGH